MRYLAPSETYQRCSVWVGMSCPGLSFVCAQSLGFCGCSFLGVAKRPCNRRMRVMDKQQAARECSRVSHTAERTLRRRMELFQVPCLCSSTTENPALLLR